MLKINITMNGPQASGKTRSTKAIKMVLRKKLGDKPYSVVWVHQIDGVVTERGGFSSEE